MWAAESPSHNGFLPKFLVDSLGRVRVNVFKVNKACELRHSACHACCTVPQNIRVKSGLTFSLVQST